MQATWHDIIQRIAQFDFGVDQTSLPMVRHPDGRTARVNTPPIGITPRRAAVLVVVSAVAQSAQLLLTQRKSHLREHAGEISFPGGRIEADEDATQAALREGFEELALDVTQLHIYGQLHDVYVPRSNHLVTPVIAWSHQPITYTPSPAEVHAVIEAPLQLFVDPQTLAYETRNIQEQWYEVPYFLVNQHKVWGATALMLCDLAERIRRATSST